MHYVCVCFLRSTSKNSLTLATVVIKLSLTLQYILRIRRSKERLFYHKYRR